MTSNLGSRSVGILAYGSLIDEPGIELEPLITQRIACQTPFSVEYARISKTRDFAPTLIPVKDEGSTVNAVILVLEPSLSLDDAKSMLWRRETRKTESSYKHKSNPGIDDVQIQTIKNFHGIEEVIYTSIGSNLALNSPGILAKLAIESILNNAGEKKIDGVRYLQSAKKNGIITPKTGDYEKCILEETQTETLDDAIQKLDSERPAHLAGKADIDAFEKKVTEIADFICEYGFAKTFSDSFKPQDLGSLLEKHKSEFIRNCHEGFKKGQDEILKLMLAFEDRREYLNGRIKELRKKKKKNIDVFLQEIKTIEWKENILRHIIDAAAWQIIGGQLYISRRLYHGVEGNKRLLKSNIQSVIDVAKELNKVDSDFALISDLSSYIQTGDILLRKGDGSLSVVEVKEGKKNQESFDVLNKILDIKDKTPVEDIMKSVAWNKKSLEQFGRNLRQFEKAFNVVNVLNNDKEIDSSGLPVNIITPKEDTPRFENELSNLSKELQKNGLWAYNVIESCLHLGMYKGPLRFVGPTILEKIGEYNTKSHVIVDFRRVVKSLNRPLLMFPYRKEFLFDIMFGRTKFFLMLDIERYMTLFSEFEMEAKWLSRGETMKAVENKKHSGLFIYKNRGIAISSLNNTETMYLTDGLLTRMFFEFVYPSYTAYSCRYLLGIESGKEDLKDDPDKK